MKSPPSDHHCQAKRDTITTNVISSFNGRRLVTSLILVITTIILLILLVVNLNCIIFTEATVNTTAIAATQTASTTTSPSSPISTTTPTNTTTTTTTTITTASPPSSSYSSNSNAFSSFNPLTNFKPLVNSTTNSENSGSNLVSSNSNNNNNNTIETPVVLAKIIKNSVSNITSGCGIMANTTATTTTTATNSSLMAVNSNSSLATNVDTNEQQQEVTKEGPCNVATSEIRQQTNNQTSSTNETSKYFDIEFARKTFEDSMADKNAISLYHYLNGFKELMKFFHSLGTIFLFVTSDLETKIGLLEGYRNAEKGGCNPAYLTIQSAIEYETKENLLRDPKRQSAARTILRLHRALEFLSALMLNLSKLDDVSETAPAAREAYSSTLANYHPWTIRTIASFAMRTLPRKKILVESVLGKEHSTNETLTNERMLMLANVTENLFSIVDKYYEEKEIKDLP